MDLGNERGYIGRVVLEIGVHGDNDVAVGEVEPRAQGRRLAEVAPELDDPDVAARFLDFQELFEGAVDRAVVDEDYLPFIREDRDRTLQLGKESFEAFAFVKYGYDYAKINALFSWIVHYPQNKPPRAKRAAHPLRGQISSPEGTD